MFLQLAAAGWRFAYVDERLANYRWPTAASGKSYDHRGQARNLLQMWAVLAARHPHLPGPTRQLRDRYATRSDHASSAASGPHRPRHERLPQQRQRRRRRATAGRLEAPRRAATRAERARA